MKQNTIILGTRGSPLALAQTKLIQRALETCGVGVWIEEIQTTGDRRMDINLTTGRTAQGEKLDKGLFTKELELALLEGRIDAAVHSLKDLPTTLPPGLEIAAIPERGAVSDVLITKSAQGLSGIPPGALLATSSDRRRRQLLAQRPDLQICDIRGNVGTRLQKLKNNPQLAGILLARAGLERLQWAPENDALFMHETEILPAAGQGALAVEICSRNLPVKTLLTPLQHEPTVFAVRAERALLQMLGGGCNLPLGVHAHAQDGTLRLRAVLFTEQNEIRRADVEGPATEPELLAANALQALGAQDGV